MKKLDFVRIPLSKLGHHNYDEPHTKFMSYDDSDDIASRYNHKCKKPKKGWLKETLLLSDDEYDDPDFDSPEDKNEFTLNQVLPVSKNKRNGKKKSSKKPEETKESFNDFPFTVRLDKRLKNEEMLRLEKEFPKLCEAIKLTEEVVIHRALKNAPELLKKIIQGLRDFQSDNANSYVLKLSGCLKDILYDKRKCNMEFRKHLKSSSKSSTDIKAFQEQVFTMLYRIFQMQISSSYEVKRLQDLLSITFEMNILSSGKMSQIIKLYESFCKCKGNQRYRDFLENLNDLVKMPHLKEDHINLVPIHKESKMVVIPEVVDIQCIVCADKRREIMFLPCCHFLTCILCSLRISKCPMCMNNVENLNRCSGHDEMAYIVYNLTTL